MSFFSVKTMGYLSNVYMSKIKRPWLVIFFQNWVFLFAFLISKFSLKISALDNETASEQIKALRWLQIYFCQMLENQLDTW